MASTKITGMSELITIQSQITMKANEFLSLFGLSPDKTLATIESREERVVLFRLPFRGSTENSVSEFSSIRKCRTIIHYFGIQE